MSNAIKRFSPVWPVPARDSLFFPIEQKFNEFFDEFFNPSVVDSVKGSQGYPKLDIHSDNGDWVVRAAVPGVLPENLKVEIQDRTVTINGEMEKEYKAVEDTKYYISELKKSRFSRSFTLPEHISDEAIDASVKDGILTLKFATLKSASPPEAKQIEVKKL